MRLTLPGDCGVFGRRGKGQVWSASRWVLKDLQPTSGVKDKDTALPALLAFCETTLHESVYNEWFFSSF